MLRKMLATDGSDYSAVVMRLALAVVIFPHGAQKVLGAFGGNGFSATMGYFTENLGIPWIFAFLAVVAEFAGPLGLALGLLTRPAAFGIGCTMAVATTMHMEHGFFMNWFGNQAGEGFEYHLLALGLAIALMIKGGGALSVDHRLATK